MSKVLARKLLTRQRVNIKRMVKKKIAVGSNAQILAAYPVGYIMEPFALKRIKSGNGNIEHEVEALRACHHISSVCDCIDVIEEEKYTYIVMPHYDRSLLDVVRADGTMPQDQVQEIITDVLQTIISCHEQGVAHLDIKPDNLMEDGDGNTILIDFGSSHTFEGGDFFPIYEEDDWLLDTRASCGTEQYAAPELADNTFSPTKSDMWGVAATAVSLLTAEFPEKGITRLEDYVESDSSLHQVITQGLQVEVSDRISPPEALSVLSED